MAVRGRSQWSEALHHRNRVTWSISTPRSAASSSVARYDSRYRRYRRNRDHSRREAEPGKARRLLNLSERLSSANATVPVNHVCHLEIEHILGSPPWYR